MTPPAPASCVSHSSSALLPISLSRGREAQGGAGGKRRGERTVPVLAVLVADLAARLSAAVLAVLEVARVEVGADDALVELGARDVAQRRDGVLVEEEPGCEARSAAEGEERGEGATTHSTKQNPHGVFKLRSRPMMMRLISPTFEKSS